MVAPREAVHAVGAFLHLAPGAAGPDGEVAALIDGETTLEYIAETAGMKRLMELGLMRSPAIAVDGKVVLIGYEPSVDKIRDLIVGKQG